MQDISVIYFSHVTLIPGMGTRDHVHDYWHFALAHSGICKNTNNVLRKGPRCNCAPAGQIHHGILCEQTSEAINVMFFVNDESLRRELEVFPFDLLKLDDEDGDYFFGLLDNLLNQLCDLSGREELANASFSYFLHLFMEHYRKKTNDLLQKESLGERCIRYIEENYMNQIMVEDVARHIMRSENYTSALFRKEIGMSLVEYLNKVRIKHACCQLSYSGAGIEVVARDCGFRSVRHFSRVFKSVMNTTPNRFRTSHRVEDMYFVGDREQYKTRYHRPSFTYIPSAQKRIDWETPLDYIDQLPRG